MPLGADRAGFYSTAPLEKTLREIVDFPLINRCNPRLTVGAAHVRTSQMRYFDSRDMEIGVKHIMASGALPPGQCSSSSTIPACGGMMTRFALR
jgi:NTE family protein